MFSQNYKFSKTFPLMMAAVIGLSTLLVDSYTATAPSSFYRNQQHVNHRQMEPSISNQYLHSDNNYNNRYRHVMPSRIEQQQQQQELLNIDDEISIDQSGENLEQQLEQFQESLPMFPTQQQKQQQQPKINQSTNELEQLIATTTTAPAIIATSTDPAIFYTVPAATTTTIPEILFPKTTTTTTTTTAPAVPTTTSSAITMQDTTTTTPTTPITTTTRSDPGKLEQSRLEQTLEKSKLVENPKFESNSILDSAISKQILQSDKIDSKFLDQELSNQIEQEMSEPTESIPSSSSSRKSSSKPNRIKAAVYTRYSIVNNMDDLNNNPMFTQWMPLAPQRESSSKESRTSHSPIVQQNEDFSDDIASSVPIIEVIPRGGRPLEIHFKSSTKRIRLVQSMIESDEPLGKQPMEPTIYRSEEEPQKYFHKINKPIIQEVREIIMPYRKVFQEIRPVQEDIRTVVSSSRSSRWSNVNNKFNSKTTKTSENSPSSNSILKQQPQSQLAVTPEPPTPSQTTLAPAQAPVQTIQSPSTSTGSSVPSLTSIIQNMMFSNNNNNKPKSQNGGVKGGKLNDTPSGGGNQGTMMSPIKQMYKYGVGNNNNINQNQNYQRTNYINYNQNQPNNNNNNVRNVRF